MHYDSIQFMYTTGRAFLWNWTIAPKKFNVRRTYVTFDQSCKASKRNKRTPKTILVGSFVIRKLGM